MKGFIFSCCIFFVFGCNTSKTVVGPNEAPSASSVNLENIGMPIITFDDSLIDIGTIKQGDKKNIEFHFKNTGDADLLIELVTACNCATIEYETNPIPPGARSYINVVFDSTRFSGAITKVIDIIANTDPIVVEAKFTVNVLE